MAEVSARVEAAAKAIYVSWLAEKMGSEGLWEEISETQRGWFLEYAADALAAAEAVDTAHRRAGFLIVPAEPTEEMLQAGLDADIDYVPTAKSAFTDRAEVIWNAMARAAGQSPIMEAPSGLMQPMATAPRDREILLATNYGFVSAIYAPGEWSEDTPLSPREYSGAVWVCHDGEFEIEIEENADPFLEDHGDAFGWFEVPSVPDVVVTPAKSPTDLSAAAVLATVMREHWVENHLSAEGQVLVAAALARCFPEDVHSVERCDAGCAETGCDECPTDAQWEAADLKLADFMLKVTEKNK